MAQTFPLMKLPPELRNCIYEAVVTSERIAIKKKGRHQFFHPQPFASSSRLLRTNKEVSSEYNAVLQRLVLDPKATDIVIEEWVTYSPPFDLGAFLESYSSAQCGLICSRLKLYFVLSKLVNQPNRDESFWEAGPCLWHWGAFCSINDVTAEYQVVGSKGRSACLWKWLEERRKYEESQGRRIGKEQAKILRVLEDASR